MPLEYIHLNLESELSIQLPNTARSESNLSKNERNYMLSMLSKLTFRFKRLQNHQQ